MVLELVQKVEGVGHNIHGQLLHLAETFQQSTPQENKLVV
jgi:hypothetical protein